MTLCILGNEDTEANEIKQSGLELTMRQQVLGCSVVLCSLSLITHGLSLLHMTIAFKIRRHLTHMVQRSSQMVHFIATQGNMFFLVYCGHFVP